MASSSDWIAAASQGDNGPASAANTPAWIAALPQPGRFVAGLPFAKPAEPSAGEAALDDPPARAPEPAAPGECTREIEAAAHARGVEEGRAAARAELDERAEHLRALHLSFQTLDKVAGDALAQELCETVIALCSAVIENFQPDRAALLALCETAAARLGAAAGECALHLNPVDIDLVGDEALARWQVHADPALERGALRLEGPDGEVCDGPAQWRRAIADALRG